MNQLTPARGRKHKLLCLCPIPFGNQLTPARGRKQQKPYKGKAQQESTHPREGTETCILPCHLPPPWRINSPPRGDGNLFIAISAKLLPRINSPPRGDETQRIPHSHRLCLESTHPREGTETHQRGYIRTTRPNQLTPARGRKLMASGVSG